MLSIFNSFRRTYMRNFLQVSETTLLVLFQPMAPFILTRDRLQAQVIGAGYPSLPTYTLEEFYEQKYKDTQPVVNRLVLDVSRHYQIV